MILTWHIAPGSPLLMGCTECRRRRSNKREPKKRAREPVLSVHVSDQQTRQHRQALQTRRKRGAATTGGTSRTRHSVATIPPRASGRRGGRQRSAVFLSNMRAVTLPRGTRRPDGKLTNNVAVANRAVSLHR